MDNFSIERRGFLKGLASLVAVPSVLAVDESSKPLIWTPEAPDLQPTLKTHTNGLEIVVQRPGVGYPLLKWGMPLHLGDNTMTYQFTSGHEILVSALAGGELYFVDQISIHVGVNPRRNIGMNDRSSSKF